MVEACVASGDGAEVTVTLGGKTELDLHGEPIESLTGYVKAVTDGRYRNQGPMMTGTEGNIDTTVGL